MTDWLEPLAGGLKSPPLVGKFYNVLDLDPPLPLVFVFVDSASEEAAATIRSLREASEDAMIVALCNRENNDASAVSDIEVMTLEAGADDCLAVPFDLGVILARLRSSASRVGRHRRQTASGRLNVNRRSHKVTLDGNSLKLSAMEFRLLLELWRNRGRVVSREELQCSLWGAAGPEYQEALKQLVYRLRRRLGDGSDLIATTSGAGYSVQE